LCIRNLPIANVDESEGYNWLNFSMRRLSTRMTPERIPDNTWIRWSLLTWCCLILSFSERFFDRTQETDHKNEGSHSQREIPSWYDYKHQRIRWGVKVKLPCQWGKDLDPKRWHMWRPSGRGSYELRTWAGKSSDIFVGDFSARNIRPGTGDSVTCCDRACFLSLLDPTNKPVLMDQQNSVSGRASVSDSAIATQGPVPIFDLHLRFLTDSYISFFQERWAVQQMNWIRLIVN